MTEPTRRDWWQLVEEHLDGLPDRTADDAEFESDGNDVPALDDPWAEGPEAPALTSEQRALLEGVDDQPGVPRVGHDPLREPDQPPHPRLAPRTSRTSDNGDDREQTDP